MRILVTGGTGYIGSHTVVELQKSGYEVVIIDNLFNSEQWIVEHIEKITGKRPEFHQFDLTDEQKTAQFFKENNDLEGVIHFAAFKAVGESVKNPLKYYNNNLKSLFNILLAMQENSISNFVFSSSCTVYGEPDSLPVKESSPVKEALSPYGNTKQISEEVIHDATKSSDIKAVSLRYFNPIGAHDSIEIGELPLGVPDNLVPYITQTAIGKRKQLSVFGDDYNTPDGTCIRDYIHVVDLAQAHVVAIKRLMDEKNKSPFEVFNLGTGNGYSVLQAIKAFEKVSGQKLNYKIVERRSGDVEKVYADTKFANEELGWKTKRNLEDMMKSAWEWEKKLSK